MSTTSSPSTCSDCNNVGWVMTGPGTSAPCPSGPHPDEQYPAGSGGSTSW